MSQRPNNIHLVFVDDDPVTGSVMQRNCEQRNYLCEVYQSPVECFDALLEKGADMLITDLRMPEMSGFELLEKIQDENLDIPVVVMTGYSSVENAVQAMKLGASDFIKKPFEFDELDLIIQRTMESSRLKTENKLLKKCIKANINRFGMIGSSEMMQVLFAKIEKVAEVSCNVIIHGESGTGKELVARALHEYSPRVDCPFVIIDCGALTESLLETELFGHEKGAFTGAVQRKTGLMEQSSGGTLFLDEISNISDAMQMKLMRAIESQTITPVGSTKTISIDLRIIAASNRDLEAMVAEGQFRHDFYHRLNVVNIEVPPLSKRKQDIPDLVKTFLDEFSLQYKKHFSGFDKESLQRLSKAQWPGNIRQLRNVVERCAILGEGSELEWLEPTSEKDEADASGHESVLDFNFKDGQLLTLEELEQQYISYILSQSDGKKLQAAKILGIDKTTLWRKLRKYGKDPEE